MATAVAGGGSQLAQPGAREEAGPGILQGVAEQNWQHKRTISYCVKDGSGAIHAEGTIPATRFDLDRWKRAFALLTKTYHGSRITGHLRTELRALPW